MLGRNVKTVDRLLADLRNRGLVKVVSRFDEHGGQLANTYRIVVAESAPEKGRAAASSAGASSEHGDARNGKGAE